MTRSPIFREIKQDRPKSNSWLLGKWEKVIKNHLFFAAKWGRKLKNPQFSGAECGEKELDKTLYQTKRDLLTDYLRAELRQPRIQAFLPT
jgi:hypothetical protein